jgi:hypothetical protein
MSAASFMGPSMGTCAADAPKGFSWAGWPQDGRVPSLIPHWSAWKRSKSFAFTIGCDQTKDPCQPCFCVTCEMEKSFKKALFTHLVNSNILGK